MKKPEFKDSSRRIVIVETVAFLLIFALIWLNEICDLPFYLGAPLTPINWQEAFVESLAVLILGLFSVLNTRRLLERTRVLEGILPICSCCKKIRDDKNHWQSVENFVSERTEAEFSHSMCEDCAKEMYPELFNSDGSLKKNCK